MKKLFTLWSILGLSLILGFVFRAQITSKLNSFKLVQSSKGYTGSLNDPIQEHLKHAQCWNKHTGSSLPSDKLSLLNATEYIGLKYIESTNIYSVGWMEYSVPFLFSEAHTVLEEIAQDVQAAIKQKNLPKYKLRVTSLIRSSSSQKKLTQKNEATPYWYGYTFSISHHNFFKVNLFRKDIDGDILKKELEDVLFKKQQQKQILVHSGKDSTFFTITLRCPVNTSP